MGSHKASIQTSPRNQKIKPLGKLSPAQCSNLSSQAAWAVPQYGSR